MSHKNTRQVNDDKELKPTRGAKDQLLTLDASTAQSLAALAEDTTHVLFTVESAAVRYRLDGTAPTASLGHYRAATASWVWNADTASVAKFISTSGAATVRATELTM